MSALTSSMAVRWSGVGSNGNASSSSRCHGVSGANAWPGRVDALLVEHHQLLGDLGHRRAHLGLGLLPLATAHAAERCGDVAAGVVAHRVDLVGRHVELVVAAVLEQQVVALDAADGPLDHAAVAGDAVLVVHDVVAGLEVVEEARPRRAGAVGPGGGRGADR